MECVCLGDHHISIVNGVDCCLIAVLIPVVCSSGGHIPGIPWHCLCTFSRHSLGDTTPAKVHKQATIQSLAQTSW